VAGHPLTLSVLVPALIVPGAFFTVLAAYPLLERRFTGDHDLHLLADRPRDGATRTAIGAAGITFYGCCGPRPPTTRWPTTSTWTSTP
jgi:ubiquinol-cytochrome c reductase cytochrome b subunit